jgi:3',5'-cyclic-nucleotide phosphodiesterase
MASGRGPSRLLAAARRGGIAAAVAALLLLLGVALASGQSPAFVAIVLGAGGGPGQDDLSAYLLAPAGSADFACLDAGTLLPGIRAAYTRGSFRAIGVPTDQLLSPEGWLFRTRIRAYLLSHAHLDHVAGLVVDSPEDAGGKPILGLPETIDRVRDHLFNGKVWPNFADEGERPLKRYHYVRLTPEQEQPIPGTAMTVEPWALSHGGDVSTAFVIRAGGAAVLYAGDTGPDAVERSTRLRALWTRLAPLVRDGALRGMFLEVSYPDGRPDDQLYGHLTPAWLLHELRALAQLVDAARPREALRRLTVVVTHVKPTLARGLTARERVARDLADRNDLGLRFVLARQGDRIEL